MLIFKLLIISTVMCRKGDDPLTTEQNNRKIELILQSTVVDFEVASTVNSTVTNSTNVTIPLEGFIGLKLYGVTAYIPMPTNSTADPEHWNALCKEALERSAVIGSVACNYTVRSSTRHDIVIEFESWPSEVVTNNIYSHTGNPAIGDFYCDVSKTTIPVLADVGNQHNSTVLCILNDLVSDNVKGTFAYVYVVSMYVYDS